MDFVNQIDLDMSISNSTTIFGAQNLRSTAPKSNKDTSNSTSNINIPNLFSNNKEKIGNTTGTHSAVVIPGFKPFKSLYVLFIIIY